MKSQYPNQYSNLSDDPVNYYLTSFNFDPEIAKVNGGEGWLGLSFKNINISTAPAPPPSSTSGFFCSADRKILWQCGLNSSPGSGWVIQSNGCYHYEYLMAVITWPRQTPARKKRRRL